MMDVNADLLQWSIKTSRNFKERKVHSPFIDNIWGNDLADRQLISKLNKGIRFLLRVIDIFSKTHWLFL